MKISYTASAILSDNTIVPITAIVNDKNIILSVSVLKNGYYRANKQYNKTLDISENFISNDIKKIIEDEVKGIANSLDYKITFNF